MHNARALDEACGAVTAEAAKSTSEGMDWGAGAARGIRTPDPVITNDVLYRLSYCGEPESLVDAFGHGLETRAT